MRLEVAENGEVVEFEYDSAREEAQCEEDSEEAEGRSGEDPEDDDGAGDEDEEESMGTSHRRRGRDQEAEENQSRRSALGMIQRMTIGSFGPLKGAWFVTM